MGFCIELHSFSCSDKGYFVDLFVRASNTPAIKMYEKVWVVGSLFIVYVEEFYFNINYLGESENIDAGRSKQ